MNAFNRDDLEITKYGLAQNPQEPGDYFDNEGLLCCGKCHTRKQRLVRGPKSFGDQLFVVGQRCRCAEEKYQTQKKADEHEKFLQELRNRCDGLVDMPQKECTFERDDNNNPDATDLCRWYIDNWEAMQQEHDGIILFGGVGTGKTFLAQCMASALIEKSIMAGVTSFPKILNVMQAATDDERRTLIKSLGWFELLVIDDLGAERDTSYSNEQVFNVVDARSRSRKPIIVTTNLTSGELVNPPSLAQKRIYDRILGMCSMRVNMAGESRRQGIAKARSANFIKTFGYEKGEQE